MGKSSRSTTPHGAPGWGVGALRRAWRTSPETIAGTAVGVGVGVAVGVAVGVGVAVDVAVGVRVGVVVALAVAVGVAVVVAVNDGTLVAVNRSGVGEGCVFRQPTNRIRTMIIPTKIL